MSLENHGAPSWNSEAPSWKNSQSVGVRFGHRLRDLRTQRGLTQLQLGMTSGLDRSFISDVERGVKEPTISSIDLLASALGITIAHLVKDV